MKSALTVKIEQLKQQIGELTGEQPIFGTMSGCPPQVEIAFLEHILAFHRSSTPTPLVRDVFRVANLLFPSADQLMDADLPAKLWDLVGELAKRSMVVEFTDHLSDRDLYAYLWAWIFEDATLRMPPPGNILHMDILGCRRREDLETYLRFYADETTRLTYSKDFPDEVLPEHANPPFHRDHLLPGHEGRPHDR